MYGTLKITAWSTVRVICTANGIPPRKSAQIRSAGPPAPVGTTTNAPSSPIAISVARPHATLYAPYENAPWNSAA
jgi:hypothetical protein